MKNVKKYATLKDVAKLAGTSIATVSYIMNGSEDRYVSEELSQRVLMAAKELNYMKSTMASSLKGKMRKVIGVLVPQFGNVFFTRITMAIEEIAQEHDYIITICNSFDDPKKEKRIIERLIEQRVDGFIVSPSINGEENMEIIRNLGIPYVVVERPLKQKISYDFISSDNFGGGYLSTKHLIDQGHKRIGFVGWDTEIENLTERTDGYIQSMDEESLDILPGWIQLGELNSETGYKLTEELMKDKSITAMVFGHHVLAEGGIMCFRNHGLDIPKDISTVVIGSPKWTQMTVPKLTCIVQSEKEIGEKAAKCLLEKINYSSESPGNIQTIIPSQILIGESVRKI